MAGLYHPRARNQSPSVVSLVGRVPRLLLSSASFKKWQGLQLELLRLPKFDPSLVSPCSFPPSSSSSPVVSCPSNSTFQFDIRESRRSSRFRYHSRPFGGLPSSKVAPKSPRSLARGSRSSPSYVQRRRVLYQSRNRRLSHGGYYLRVRTCTAKDPACPLSGTGNDEEKREMGEGERKDIRCERNVLRGSGDLTVASSTPCLASTCAFYGTNFLKDVQTTKLNAQLDVKGRLWLNICRRGVRPIFLVRCFACARASFMERRVECGIGSLFMPPSAWKSVCQTLL